MPSIRCVVGGLVLAATAAFLGAARDASAGESRASVADAVTAVMGAADTRMKAAMEEARLLEAAGRRDEALARLRSIPAIYDEATRVVRSLVGGPDAPAAASEPARRAVPTPRHSEAPPPLAQPARDPVRAAVVFLLRCQAEDGMFLPALGAAPGDAAPRALSDDEQDEVTGAVLLALCDVAGPRVDRASPLGAAVHAAADGLVARATRGDRPLGGVAAWGLATALSRTGEAAWVDPVRRAVLGALDAREDAPLPSAGPRGEAVADAAVAAALLHEARPLLADAHLVARVDRVLAAIGAAAAALPLDATWRPASRIAADLLRRHATAPQDLVGPPARLAVEPSLVAGLDARAILWGTVRAAADGMDEPAGRLWWERVLVPAMNRQEADGPAAGSWPAPAAADDDGGGRVLRTALLLLAWKVPTTPWYEPVGR